MSFTHLHLHTEYSLLDGANKLGELAKTLQSQGTKAVAMTDHGNMFGAIDFYKTMQKVGIKPIIGIEAYLQNGDELTDKSTKQRFHIILLAKDETGYKNLMYLSSMSFIDGFYYYPRINKKILQEHSEGLICTAACLQGEVSWNLNTNERNLKFGAGGYEGAKEAALWYKNIFGDDFYLEIMRHGIYDQRRIDDDILRLSKELDIKVIATNDTHYTFKDRAKAHEAFMCIAMGKTLDDPNRLKHSVHEFYVKTKEQMEAIFADIPEVLQNTQEIVDKCNLKLNLGNPTPPNFKFTLERASQLGLDLPYPNKTNSFENDAALFEFEAKSGLKERLKFIPQNKHETYVKRLEDEIATINKMNFPGYMLIVADFINWAKRNAIPVGPGRGSAAGSLCAYSLRITDIDPLPYNLLFERFLNPERVSMPDIDVDFCQERRGEVIDYVVEKYGKFNVAQVATFGKLLAKGVIRDVARVCDMPLRDADAMAKLIPDELKISLDEAYEKEPKLKELVTNDPMAARVWKFAKDLEGLNRNAGMHAAGIVISNEPLWNKTPLFRQTKSEDGNFITQYTKDFLEDVDLIKFDFLGLKTLDVIDNAIKLIKMRYNKEIVWENIDFNDKKTYKTIQAGHTLGIFQLDSGGMQKLGSDLKPDCFEDIIAMIALYRPGPMDLIPEFVARKHKEAKIEYLIDDIKDILEPTYGVIVYQEQVMQIVQKVGGFSLGGADIVRRAMSKKKEDEMKRLKDEYLKGAQKSGYSIQSADALFEMIMKFASYGFNKSHAAAYAMITFQTAYLKTYYLAEFMAALITSEENKADKVVKYIEEAKRLGIRLLPPSINQSLREFGVVDDEESPSKKSIIYGIGAIKGVGLAAIDNIIELRQEGEFADLDDFVSRVDNFRVNKKVIESLIFAGAMDCLGKTRLALMQNIENILEAMKKITTIKKEASTSLFGEDEDMGKIKVNFIENSAEYDLKNLLKFEQQCMGIYLSGHPLEDYEEQISKIDYTPSSKFDEFEEGSSQDVLCVGKIEDCNIKITKKGSKMAILNIIDLQGSFEAICFEKQLYQIDSLDEDARLEPHAFMFNLRKEDGQCKLSLLSINSLEEAISNEIKPRENRRTKSFNQNGYNQTKFTKNSAAIKPKTLQELAVLFELDKLNKESIQSIYKMAHQEHQNPKNDKKLTIKIKSQDKTLVYNTKFLVSDDFIGKLGEFGALNA